MRKYKEDECGYCKQVKVIAAKGYCRACYGRLQKTGSLEYKKKGKKSICVVDGCDKYVVSHGYCDKHRQRIRTNGTPELKNKDWGKREKHELYSTWSNLKRFRGAQTCDRWLKDFWVFVEDVKTRPSKNHKFRPIDKDAEINQDNWNWVEIFPTKTEEEKEYLKKWARIDRAENPDKYRDAYLKKKYGISLEDYLRMEGEQAGKCAICGNPETGKDHRTKEVRNLAVDHCHETGKVRGLLCSKCNTAIGKFNDDINIIEKAIDYLKNS